MSTLPDKWAVEITCLEDAVRLQKIFPDGSLAGNYFIQELFFIALGTYKKTPIGMSACGSGKYIQSQWRYSALSWYKENGYTILSIEQLENALKDNLNL